MGEGLSSVYKGRSSSALLFLLLSMLVIGCSGKHLGNELASRQKKARDYVRKIAANPSGAKDVLSDDDRNFLYRQLYDESDDDSTAALALVAIAYRVPEEKSRLERHIVPLLDAKSVALNNSGFIIVKYLKIKGYDDKLRSLLSKVQPMQGESARANLLRDELKEYLQ